MIWTSCSNIQRKPVQSTAEQPTNTINTSHSGGGAQQVSWWWRVSSRGVRLLVSSQLLDPSPSPPIPSHIPLLLFYTVDPLWSWKGGGGYCSEASEDILISSSLQVISSDGIYSHGGTNEWGEGHTVQPCVTLCSFLEKRQWLQFFKIGSWTVGVAAAVTRGPPSGIRGSGVLWHPVCEKALKMYSWTFLWTWSKNRNLSLFTLRWSVVPGFWLIWSSSFQFVVQTSGDLDIDTRMP